MGSLHGFIIYLLQENSLPGISDFALIVQTALAVGTLVLAIITYLQGLRTDQQGKKIHDLSNIVVEMKRQSDTIEKRYELEKLVKLSEIIPYFKYDHKDINIPGKVTLHLQNIGVEAIEIDFDSGSYKHYDVFLKDRMAHHMAGVQIDLSFRDGVVENVEFFIRFKGNNGIIARQLIHKYPNHDFEIKPPIDPF